MPKSERLCAPTMISRLFEQGKSEYAYPLRLTYRVVDASGLPPGLCRSRFSLIVNVPKKRFKRAVDRVRLRRLMREAWRVQRTTLRDRFMSQRPGELLHTGIVYVGTEKVPYAKVHDKTAKLIAFLEKELLDLDTTADAAHSPAREEGAS